MKPVHSRTWPLRLVLLFLGTLLATAALAANLQYLDDKAEGEYDLTGSLAVKSPAALNAALAFNCRADTGDGYLLTVRASTVSLSKQVGGKVTPLGKPAAVALKSGVRVPFTLQRRAWRIALVWDNAVILRAYDGALVGGKIGSRAAGGAWDDLALQRVGDVVAQDDFVREEGAQSIWQPAVGTWEAKTLRDDEQAAREEADKSANAFSYLGSGLPHAITLAGNWFWDTYRLEAAVRPMGRGAAGLVFYYQDDKNYLALRITCAADPAPLGDRVQLIAVQGGKEKVLAEKPGGYEPTQWYDLRVQVCDDLIEAFVDDVPRLQANCVAFGQGQVGLYVEGKSGVFSDDVSCVPYDTLRDGFAAALAGKWHLGAGFTQANGQMSHRGTLSLCTTGPDWQRYACAVETTQSGTGMSGLAFCYQGAQQYCVLRCLPSKAQLVQVTEKGANVLAEKPLPPGAKRRLRVSVEEGLITGAVDDTIRLQAIVPGAKGGAIGLYAEGNVSFDNVNLWLLAPRRSSHVTKEFTITDKHPEMAAWASTRAPWVPPAEGQDDWWTKGDYYGETSLTFTVPSVGGKAGSARAIIGGEPGAKSGVLLTVTTTEKSKQLTLTLSAGEAALKSATTEVEGDAHVVFSREAGLVVVRVNDNPVLTLAR